MTSPSPHSVSAPGLAPAAAHPVAQSAGPAPAAASLSPANAETRAELAAAAPSLASIVPALRRLGYDELRPHQAEVLGHVLSGRDCLAVLPTGSGKSLCYGLPAQTRPGLVLVLSPLIALIRDQVQRFTASGIACAALDSLQTPMERTQVWDRLDQGQLQLLLISPERLAREDFRSRLARQPLQLVAIDEAHCISQFGSHFRPDYRLIGDYLDDFGPVQKLALTATATTRVRDDITVALRLQSPALVWGELARANLQLKVIRADKVTAQMAAMLQAVLNTQGSGIVYAPTRRQVRDVHRMLCEAGVAAVPYHAGLTPDQRHSAQTSFMSGKARVVVATHAFGLGIDKPDIRFVHHAGLPASLEQYVQEIGRAGRDGAPSQCGLIYGSRDFHIQKFMIDKSYPAIELLQRVLAVVQDYVAGSEGESIVGVLRQLQAAIPDGAADDLAEALNVLCREGVLCRLRARGAYATASAEAEILISDGRAAEAGELFRDYPLRKAATMAKLEAMRAFAGTTGDFGAFLQDYFQQ